MLASEPPPPPVELLPLLFTAEDDDDDDVADDEVDEDVDEEGPNDVGGLLLKLVLGMAAGFDELELLVLLLQLDEGAFVAGAAIFCPFGSHGTAAMIEKIKQKIHHY